MLNSCGLRVAANRVESSIQPDLLAIFNALRAAFPPKVLEDIDAGGRQAVARRKVDAVVIA